MSIPAYIPTALRQLLQSCYRTAAVIMKLSGFKGRDVTVIGGGQSALETRRTAA